MCALSVFGVEVLIRYVGLVWVGGVVEAWGLGDGDGEMVVRRVLGDGGLGGRKTVEGAGFQTRWLESCSPVNRAAVPCSSLGRMMRE